VQPLYTPVQGRLLGEQPGRCREELLAPRLLTFHSDQCLTYSLVVVALELTLVINTSQDQLRTWSWHFAMLVPRGTWAEGIWDTLTIGAGGHAGVGEAGPGAMGHLLDS
jgi:hypothetical protein